MRIIVTSENKKEVVYQLNDIKSGVISADTETRGLKWNDPMFALQLAVQGGDSYYFNFNKWNIEPNVEVLDLEILTELRKLWANPEIRWIFGNAKFDMRRLAIEGIHLNGEIYDVLLMDRIRYNRQFSYSLDSCLKRMGLSKNDEVSLWIKDNKAYTTHTVEGKKTKEKDLHYDRVPFNIMVHYGFDDSEDTLKLYEDQCAYFQDPENREQIDLVHSNIELVKTVFDMESTGIQLDIDYCEKQLEIEQKLAVEKAKRLEEMSAREYKSGPKWLQEVLNEQGIHHTTSEKGNPVFNKATLGSMDNAIASTIIEMRDHEKRAGTYATLLRFADENGVLHTNYRLNGTDTLRFSSSDPNLQNIEACGAGEVHTIRSAFKPREGYILVSIDYKTMEYRLCADIAGEHEWIKAINEGADPHQWVADLMGVDRKSAKTLNFMLLYGGGLAKLVMALYAPKADEDTLAAIAKVHMYKLSRVDKRDLERLDKLSYEDLQYDLELLRKADGIKKLYYNSLPNVSKLTKAIQEVGVSRGFIRNRYGMRFFLGGDSRFAYRLPNHLIQGTGACIIRSAMNKIAYQLEGMKSNMLLQIHDELLFEIHESETFVVTTLKDIMEREYKPINGMQLKCDVEYSTESWNANTFRAWEDYGN